MEDFRVEHGILFLYLWKIGNLAHLSFENRQNILESEIDSLFFELLIFFKQHHFKTLDKKKVLVYFLPHIFGQLYEKSTEKVHRHSFMKVFTVNSKTLDNFDFHEFRLYTIGAIWGNFMEAGVESTPL